MASHLTLDGPDCNRQSAYPEEQLGLVISNPKEGSKQPDPSILIALRDPGGPLVAQRWRPSALRIIYFRSGCLRSIQAATHRPCGDLIDLTPVKRVCSSHDRHSEPKPQSQHVMSHKTPVCDGCKKPNEAGNDLPCNHFLCKPCVDKELENSNPKCTACQKEFTKDHLQPHSSLCMNLTCQGGDTCGKTHLEDIVPKT
nr:unnamed protein product [Spirometra erinaceieuropaei]